MRVTPPAVTWRALVAVCLIGLVAIVLPASTVRAQPARTAEHCVINLNFVGKTVAEAKALAHQCHQQISILRVPDAAPAGKVISQSPPETGNRLVVSTGPLTNPWAVLPGAAGPPVAAACTTTLYLYEDGNAGPLTCHSKHVNVEAWDYFARLRPKIMRLPRSATVCQVARSIGSGYVSGPVNYSRFILARAYNGWHVPDGLAGHILAENPYPDTCTNDLHLTP